LGVLVLAEIGVFGGHANVGSEKEFVRHVPGIAMHDGDERLGQYRLPATERVDKAVAAHQRLASLGEGAERIHIDTLGETVAVPEKHRYA
jgi:hypothetical protein